MSDIYTQHRASFAAVSAFVIAKDGERVATIAFKFPRDGAGRLYAYVHWLGLKMERGQASGGGYDKRSAATAQAARKMRLVGPDDTLPSCELVAFHEAISHDGGNTWERALTDAGFTVWQAV